MENFRIKELCSPEDFKEGMLVSNEPGYYKKNKFGIRIENLIFFKKLKKNLIFDNLTMVPIDKSLIDFSILNEKEKRWLNSYHKKVFRLRSLISKLSTKKIGIKF